LFPKKNDQRKILMYAWRIKGENCMKDPTVDKMRILAKPKRQNKEHRVLTQIGLFGSKPDLYDAPQFDRDLAEKWGSEEQKRKHNRGAANQRPFSIKEHRATRLHYDLRLEFACVLLSWAIPEGPTYCAGKPREAIEMPDHKRKNIIFEGVIPIGMHGAGPVKCWDRGIWAPLPGYWEIEKSLQQGCLRFTLHGEKLKGNWTLRRRPDDCWRRREPIWDLIKEHDDFARSADAPSILVEAPNSVLKGRTLAEIERAGNKSKRERAAELSLF
jgi:bifunctional non-homologous end joining protein LigD